MLTRDLVSSIVLMVVAAATLWQGSSLPVGSLSSPNTGFLPVILGGLLLVLGFILFIKSLPGGKKEALPPWTGPGGWKVLLLTGASLFVVAIVFEIIGYVASIFFLMLFLLRAIGRRRWPAVVVISAASAFGFYLVFGYLLNIPLPPGIWMR